MQPNASRFTVKREVEVIDVDNFAVPVVDVELHHAKYEYTEEDGIETIDCHAFRQSFRKSKEKEKDVPMGQKNALASTSTARTTPDTTAIRGKDFPSTIGPVIQDIKAQKRTNIIQPATVPYANKRRKLDNSPHLSVSPSPLPSSSKALMTPSSRRSNVQHALPVKVKAVTPPSPDISFVSPVSKEKVASPASISRSALARARQVNANTTTSSASGNIRSSINRNSSVNPARKRVLDVIELSSDSENELEVVQIVAPSKKKLKRSSSFGLSLFSVPDVEMHEPPLPQFEPEPESEDDDWDWDPPGFNLNDASRWKSMEVNRNKFEDDVTDDLESLHIYEPKLRTPPPRPRHIQPDTSRTYHHPLTRDNGPPKFIWDRLNRVSNLHFRPRTRQHQLSFSYFRPWHLDFYDLHLNKLQSINSFKEAPGSITRVEQKGRWTAIASACDGGLPDGPDERPSDYNRPGSLMTWCNGLNIPKGHQLKRDNYRSGFKYYAVNDVKFDPNRDAFVTSGADKKVRLWTLSEHTGEDKNPCDPTEVSSDKDLWNNSSLHTFGRVPHELTFKPNESVLAVAERKVHIFILTDEGSEHRYEDFYLHHSRERHIIGSVAWGMGITANHLFVSSEPSNPDIFVPETFKGRHKVFDLGSWESLYELDATEAGDTLAVDPTGGILALSTRASVNRHILRLYDVNRQNPTAHTTIDLETFPSRYEGFEGEVNCTTFSPDGVYLAVARNDNFLHVYDSRMLTRGPLFEYEHFGESKAPSQTSTFGVVKAQWVQSEHTRRVALVTAGEDGCVRLWNPLVSSYDDENGISIAEANSDISHFSLGDRFAGEHQLVVGDCVGESRYFDVGFHLVKGHPISN
ncbi:WD40-repeat-containing domain protein [Gymnopilus junonius]|uniref:WD40-repeat-containing domain protein n=1 Tax=Gymnopilus junonius TaxID=109634 RepID=A0A9P5NV25_GYMJU|nr:WD40-repeat-containing domain protein [Gymnopilus junonius]